MVFLSGIGIAVCIAALAYFAVQGQNKQSSRHVTAGNSIDMQTGYRNITYNGKKYRYNSLITTVLYAGIDSVGEIEENEGYADAARAAGVPFIYARYGFGNVDGYDMVIDHFEELLKLI